MSPSESESSVANASQYVELPLVDTHAHVNLEDFNDDLEELLARSRSGRFPEIRGRQLGDAVVRPFVAGLICPGVDYATSRRALNLAKSHDYVYAAAGVHPNHVALLQPDEWHNICKLVADEVGAGTGDCRIVALGETGLDKYWDDAPFTMQVDYFCRTLELGRLRKLPVIIHSRDANDDLDAILHEFYGSQTPDWPVGVIHSFSGTPVQAERWLELGFCLGFGGFVTYTQKRFSDIWEAAKLAPADRILLETDSPFLTPHPVRGKIDRNEPLMTAFTARRLAELRGVSALEIAQTSTENARRLFKLPRLASAPGVDC